MAEPAQDVTPSARILLKERNYLLFLGARWGSQFSIQIQSVALGWQMYALSRHTMTVEQSAFMVGMIGLAAFVPVFVLTLPAGDAADRYERRHVCMIALAGEMISAATLLLAAWRGFASPALLLCVSALFGASRAFYNPSSTALGPTLVPRAVLPRALAWSSLASQTASIMGPAAGGLLVALSPAHAYVVSLVLYGFNMICIASIRREAKPVRHAGSRWSLMVEGLHYVWREKMIFGAITLDLFAVLLGGATALLPVFARDVLHVGASGFGLLRSAPAIGATLVAMVLAVKPIHSKAGLYILGGVATFGLATCVFAVSRALWLSVAALSILGGADMLSVYVRQTLTQLVTPDAMRGRVSAVSSMFVGASNELGEFESGVIARFLGPVGAALFGGIGAITVTALWSRLFPQLRKADKLT